MDRYARRRFEESDEDERRVLCGDLAASLAARLRAAPDFHARVEELVQGLRAVGHDLWSYDESDEFEIWGPTYGNDSRSGIVITFHMDRRVAIEWTEA